MVPAGRSYALVDEKNHGYLAPSTFTTEFGNVPKILEPLAGNYTGIPGFLSYYEICQILRSNGWNEVWLDEGKVPYAYGDGDWVAYDNIDSIIYKVNLARSFGVGGLWWYGIGYDDFKVRFKLWPPNERFWLQLDVHFEFNSSK